MKKYLFLNLFALNLFALNLFAQNGANEVKLRDIKEFPLSYNWPLISVLSVVVLLSLIFLISKLIIKLKSKKIVKVKTISLLDRINQLKAITIEQEFLDNSRLILNQIVQQIYHTTVDSFTDSELQAFLSLKKDECSLKINPLLKEISSSRFKMSKILSGKETIISEFNSLNKIIEEMKIKKGDKNVSL